uniref:Uncharacterized protein n=1 Tax=Anopheles dirus TaxID=7168 RepID=A0A182NUF6_9DIPT
MLGIKSRASSCDAFPSPDFGISSTIASSGKVQTAGNELTAAFDNVNKYGITLHSSYKVLSVSRGILYSISNDVAAGGKALGAAVATLATSTGPSIDATFGAAAGAITNMETTLTTSFAARFATLEANIGPYVGKELRDSFAVLVAAVRKLRDALGQLKPAVQQLQTAAKTVAPNLILSVLDALKNMRANVQALVYTVSTSLYNLELADKFIVDSTSRAELEMATIDASYTAYATETTGTANDMAETVRSTLAEGYGRQETAIAPIQARLDASADYTVSFQPRTMQIKEIFGTDPLASLKLDLTQLFVNYVQLMEELDNDVGDFFANDACPALQATVQVLISSVPNAVFCFEKYSYQAYNLFHDFATLVDVCYQEESAKLSVLFLAVPPLVQLILFDVEDLADSLAACIKYRDNVRCFTAISPYYEVLMAQTTAKRYYLHELVARELEASSNRLASCYMVNKYFILQQVVRISANVQLCSKNGPMSIRAEPSPDFGIKATVLGTANVVKQSGKVSATFDLVDNMNIPLTGGYALLDNMKTAVLYISSKVTSTGMAVSTALNTLAADRSNDVNGAFAPVYAAINALRTLLQSGFTAQYAALQKQGNFITTQLGDAFKSILDRLTVLVTALDRMKAGVTAARDAPGNPPNGISPDNLSRNVPAKLTFDLLDALSKLEGVISLVTFVVEDEQRKLSTADVFLGEMRTEGQTVIGNDVHSAKGLFDSERGTIATNVAGQFADPLGVVYGTQMQALGLVQSTVQAFDTYTNDLKPALDSLSLLLNADGIAALATAVADTFGEYGTAVDASIASTASVEQFFIGETCVGLRSVIDALVANSPHSPFCFAKFSPKLFNQFALSFYAVSECYDVETIRLYRLQDLLTLVIGMIVYDVEDLGEAISSCAQRTTGPACLTLIGPYYEQLATTIDEKQAYVLSYLEEETKISLQRLGSCVTTAKYMTAISVAAIISNLGTCTVRGPIPV